jgi:hypothetical protein
MNVSLALVLLATAAPSEPAPAPRSEPEPRDVDPFAPLHTIKLPDEPPPIWTEHSRTDRRSRRDPRGRLERRDYAGWGEGGRVPR